MMVALVVVCAQLAGANAALDKCRKLDKEFDTKNMPKPCQAAADDATLSISERVEALRLLAFAHILNGDDALAEPAFMRMLVFAPDIELSADAGPRFREPFANVKKRFEVEGALKANYQKPQPPPGDKGPVDIVVDVTDKLGRVVGACVRAATGDAPPLEDRLARSELSPGLVRFSGRIPEPPVSDQPATVSYEVLFEGWDGRQLPIDPPVTGTFTRGAKASEEPPPVEEEAGSPWLWVGVGSVAAIVVAAAAGGAVYCFAAGPCKTQNAWVRVRVQQ